MSTPIDVPFATPHAHVGQVDLATYIDGLANQAARRCGASHETYVQLFSQSVDEAFSDADPVRRATALAIAGEHDYVSHAEISAMTERLSEDGYCSHGLTWQTCPCGCFE